MFKVLTGTAELGGSLSLQKQTVARAAKDLEDKLNSSEVEKVLGCGAYESPHEVVLFSIVEISASKDVKTSKKGKGE